MNWPQENFRPGGTDASRWVVDVLRRSSLNRVSFTVPGGLHVCGPMFRAVADAVANGTIAVLEGGNAQGTGTDRGVADGQIATYRSDIDAMCIPADRGPNVAFVVCHEAVHAYCDMQGLQMNRLTEEATGYVATAAANYHYQRVWAERNQRASAFERDWSRTPMLMTGTEPGIREVYAEAHQVARRADIYDNRDRRGRRHDLTRPDLERLRHLINDVRWYRGIGELQQSTQHDGLAWRSQREGERYCLRRNRF